MTDSMKDLISKRSPNEPKEFQIIRKFVSDNFDETISLSSQNNQIIIIVSTSAFAGILQLRLHEIESMLPDKTVLKVGLR